MKFCSNPMQDWSEGGEAVQYSPGPSSVLTQIVPYSASLYTVFHSVIYNSVITSLEEYGRRGWIIWGLYHGNWRQTEWSWRIEFTNTFVKSSGPRVFCRKLLMFCCGLSLDRHVSKRFPTPGVEPGPSGWKPDILAVRPRGILCFRPGSNRRPSAC